MTTTAIDLFAGAGGATAGLMLAGCDVRLAIECDREAMATYAANFPNVERLPELIEKYTPRAMLRKAGLKRGELDILSACPPCQGFSTLGSRDASDGRNDYVLLVATLAQSFRPRAVIIENVPGLAADPRCEKLEEHLRTLGYGVGSWILNATDFCVPQRRRRWVMIAIRGLHDEDVTSPADTYSCPEEDHPHSVREVLAGLPRPDGCDPLHQPRQLPPSVLKRVKQIPADGGSRSDLPAKFQLDCHKRLRKSGAGSVYGRMAWDEPAPTITTRCTTPACGRFLHPEESRPITLREAAAFQSFWPEYIWRGGATTVARQIGNAVPVRFAQHLAQHALALIEQSRSRS